MWEDKIVEEVRNVRQEHAEEFGFDLKAIFADLKKQEKKSSRQFVIFSPRRVPAAMTVK